MRLAKDELKGIDNIVIQQIQLRMELFDRTWYDDRGVLAIRWYPGPVCRSLKGHHMQPTVAAKRGYKYGAARPSARRTFSGTGKREPQRVLKI